MTKIYLSPERRPKPHGKYWGFLDVYEHDVCVEIGDLTAAALLRCGFEVKIGKPEDDIRKRVAEAIEWGANYYLPIHTNAMTDGDKEGSAQGPLILRCGKEGGVSDRACQLTYNRLMDIYPRKTNQGVRQNTTFYEINSTPMLSVYAEIGFHDNGEDARWIYSNKVSISEALCRGVCDWYGVEYIGEIGNPQVGGITEAEYKELLAEMEEWKRKYLSLAEGVKALTETII